VDLDAQFTADALSMVSAGAEEKNCHAKQDRVSGAHLFYVSTKDTAAIGVRGHAATKEQQLKRVAVC